MASFRCYHISLYSNNNIFWWIVGVFDGLFLTIFFFYARDHNYKIAYNKYLNAYKQGNLKICPKCETLVSENAYGCFNCGYSFVSSNLSEKDLITEANNQIQQSQVVEGNKDMSTNYNEFEKFQLYKQLCELLLQLSESKKGDHVQHHTNTLQKLFKTPSLIIESDSDIYRRTIKAMPQRIIINGLFSELIGVGGVVEFDYKKLQYAPVYFYKRSDNDWCEILILYHKFDINEKQADQFFEYYKEYNQYIDNLCQERESDYYNLLIEYKNINIFAQNLLDTLKHTNDMISLKFVSYMNYKYGLKQFLRCLIYTEASDSDAELEFDTSLTVMADILKDQYGMSEEMSYHIAWMSIKYVAQIKYSRIWKEQFHHYIGQEFDLANPKEYILSIIHCNEVDIEDSFTFGCLTYFLMEQKYFKDNSFFPICFLDLYNDYQKIKHEDLLNIRKQQIMGTTIDDSKEDHIINNKCTIDDVDLMTGSEFEQFCADLFKKMGYNSTVTKLSSDQGIDIIAIKNNNKLGIQAKCYSGKVGNKAIQEVVAGKQYYQCDKVMVITNNYFTTAAINLAKTNDVILWDRTILIDKIALYC